MIPRRIHRIWVGPPMPAELEELGRSWRRHHPGWDHLLWGEEDLRALPLRNLDLFDCAPELVPPDAVGQLRADVARYELLLRFGGVYVDADLEALRPLDELLDPRVRAFAAFEDPARRWINNAIIGAEPGHELLRALVERLPASIAASPGARPNVVTGPQYLTRVVRELGPELTLFERELFYPYSYLELERAGEAFPGAFTVHHWNHRRTLRGRPISRSSAPRRSRTSRA